MSNLITLYDSDNLTKFQESVKEIKSGKVRMRLDGYEEKGKGCILFDRLFIKQRSNSPIYLEILLKAGLNPNYTFRFRGNTRCAASNLYHPPYTETQYTMAKLMLEYGANPNYGINKRPNDKIADYSGYQPLHHLCLTVDSHSIAMVQLLMQYGVIDNYVFNHYNLGKINTATTLHIIESPSGIQNGYGPPKNSHIRLTIRNLLLNYQRPNVSFQQIRNNRLSEVRRAEIEEEEKRRKFEEEKKRIIREEERKRILAEQKRKQLIAEENRKKALAEQMKKEIVRERERKEDVDSQIDQEKQNILNLQNQKEDETQKMSNLEEEQTEEERIICNIQNRQEIEETSINNFTENTEKEMEAYSYLNLAAKNMEFMSQNPGSNLNNAVLNMTSQLIIKACRLLPDSTLSNIRFPDEYSHLVDFEGEFTAFWENA